MRCRWSVTSNIHCRELSLESVVVEHFREYIFIGFVDVFAPSGRSGAEFGSQSGEGLGEQTRYVHLGESEFRGDFRLGQFIEKSVKDDGPLTFG